MLPYAIEPKSQLLWVFLGSSFTIVPQKIILGKTRFCGFTKDRVFNVEASIMKYYSSLLFYLICKEYKYLNNLMFKFMYLLIFVYFIFLFILFLDIQGFFSAFWEHDPTPRIGNFRVVLYKIGKKHILGQRAHIFYNNSPPFAAL